VIISPWRKVRELHDSFKHSQSGLGVAAQLIIAILMSAVVGPMAMGAMGGAATSAAATSLATTGAISTINNKGNLGAVARDVTSKDAIKGYAISGITAGLTSGLYDGWTGTETASHATTTTTNTDALTNSATVATTDGLSTWSGIGQFAANQALQNTTSAALGKLLGQGDSFSDALQRTLANTFMAAGFNWVGDVSHGQLDNGSLTKAGLHAVMGGLAAEAMGGDFKTGALAAGVNELVVAELDAQYKKMGVEDRKNLLHMSSQVLGVLTASLQGGDAKAMQVGAAVAGGATAYNHLKDHEMQSLARDLEGCQVKKTCDQVAQNYFEKHKINQASVMAACEQGVDACQAKAREIYNAVLKFQTVGYQDGVNLSTAESSIFNAFHMLNVEDNVSSAVSGAIILPSASAIAEAYGVNPNSPAGEAFIAGLATGMVAGAGKKVAGAKGILTPKDFPAVSTQISRQKQLRHLEGTPQLAERGKGGYLKDISDAQKVLDAYRSGNAIILGKNAQGFPVVRVDGVTGVNVNIGAGINSQPTNVFIIKGTKSPSIVPTSPTPKLVD